jgi:hypothetical protein
MGLRTAQDERRFQRAERECEPPPPGI